jgi:hypothetical protein
MAVITRITDFIPNTLIKSQEVDDEFNQLVNLLSGVSTNKDALLKFSDGSNPVLRVDQLGAGVIQQWLQNGTVKSRINNNGSLESIAGPVIAASQLIAAPVTIDGTTDILLKSNGFIVGYPKVIKIDVSTPGNVGTGLDTLHTFTVPAGTLAANDDWIRVYYAGEYGANDDNKRVVNTIAGSNFEDTGLIDVDSLGWILEYYLVRLSATTVRFQSLFNSGLIAVDSAGVNIVTNIGGRTNERFSTSFTVADLNSNTLALACLGESSTATNDNVKQTLSIITACQMT